MAAGREIVLVAVNEQAVLDLDQPITMSGSSKQPWFSQHVFSKILFVHMQPLSAMQHARFQCVCTSWRYQEAEHWARYFAPKHTYKWHTAALEFIPLWQACESAQYEYNHSHKDVPPADTQGCCHHDTRMFILNLVNIVTSVSIFLGLIIGFSLLAAYADGGAAAEWSSIDLSMSFVVGGGFGIPCILVACILVCRRNSTPASPENNALTACREAWVKAEQFATALGELEMNRSDLDKVDKTWRRLERSQSQVWNYMTTTDTNGISDENHQNYLKNEQTRDSICSALEAKLGKSLSESERAFLQLSGEREQRAALEQELDEAKRARMNELKQLLNLITELNQNVVHQQLTQSNQNVNQEDIGNEARIGDDNMSIAIRKICVPDMNEKHTDLGRAMEAARSIREARTCVVACAIGALGVSIALAALLRAAMDTSLLVAFIPVIAWFPIVIACTVAIACTGQRLTTRNDHLPVPLALVLPLFIVVVILPATVDGFLPNSTVAEWSVALIPLWFWLLGYLVLVFSWAFVSVREIHVSPSMDLKCKHVLVSAMVSLLTMCSVVGFILTVLGLCAKSVQEPDWGFSHLALYLIMLVCLFVTPLIFVGGMFVHTEIRYS